MRAGGRGTGGRGTGHSGTGRLLGTALLGISLLLAGCGGLPPRAHTGADRESGAGQTQGQEAGSGAPFSGGEAASEAAGERIVVTLGCVGSTHSLGDAVEAYNASHEKYYIEMVDHMPELYDHSIAEDTRERFRMDIAAGKGEDILYLGDLSATDLGYAGALMDLSTFLTPEEWEETYWENILNCVKTGDALYEIGPFFQVSFIAGDTDRMSAETGWTTEEMLACFRENDADVTALGGQGNYTAERLTEHAIDDFVDWDAGKADFCRQEFYDILEFARDEAGYVRTTRETVSSGRHIASVSGLASPSDVQYLDWMYDGRWAVKGWPGNGGNGVTASFSGEQLSVTSYCSCPEGAWDFLQYYIHLDWIEDFIRLHPGYNLYEGSYRYERMGGFPLHRQRFEEALEESAVQQYYESGEPYPLCQGDETEGIPDFFANSREDLQRIREIVAMADRRELSCYSAVDRIIGEEMSGCKAGILDAQETAAVIQNRVQLYLDESSR